MLKDLQKKEFYNTYQLIQSEVIIFIIKLGSLWNFNKRMSLSSVRYQPLQLWPVQLINQAIDIQRV